MNRKEAGVKISPWGKGDVGPPPARYQFHCQYGAWSGVHLGADLMGFHEGSGHGEAVDQSEQERRELNSSARPWFNCSGEGRFGQHHGPMAGQYLLAGVRKELDDIRRRERNIEKARDGRGQKSI